MPPGDLSNTLPEAVGQMLMLAFEGKESLPPQMSSDLARFRPAGFTLFRALNIDNPTQVRQLSEQIQRAGREAGLPPFLIAADQEGGQLMAVEGGTTPLPGNMALGAADSVELARLAGEVCGRELSAMGINVNYAPVCDVNSNPQNPVIGIRSFGEDPERVAELAAGFAVGLQSSGVAATAKHFPGHGDTTSDSHFGIPSVPHPLERLKQVELPPFAAAIQAGVKLVMTAHLALPALEGQAALPATLSQPVLTGLLRQTMGFEGVIITDAMDMRAIRQGEGLGQDALRAVLAGANLLLLTRDPADHERVFEFLLKAATKNTHLSRETDLTNDAAMAIQVSAGRVRELKKWLGKPGPLPDLDIVGCAAHRAVAKAIAERSITLVRNQAHLLPLRGGETQHLAVLLPQLVDLTPADTSSYRAHTLPQALRAYSSNVDEIIYPHDPTAGEIAGMMDHLLNGSTSYQAVILGTVNASMQPGQAALANELLRSGIPAILVALRLPYDLLVYPTAGTYLCTYGLSEPCMQALAAVLFGEAPPLGHLPITIPGLYPIGSALTD